MKVELFDVCRVDSATRTALGTIFPHASTVTGIDEDHSAIVNDPGAGNKIIFSFNSAINTTSIYTNNGDDTATVAFCAQVALYDGSTLVNLAEVKVEYTIDLLTDQATLAFNSITSAAGYTDAADSVVTFDGTLQAFFCNPSTYGILPYNELKTTQGSSISVCFQVPDGQFEVKDVVALTVKNANDIYPQQSIISEPNVVSTNTATKTCYDNSNSDTNMCITQFLLNEDFYEASEMTLTGFGTVVLELGDSSGSRKLLRASFGASSMVSRPSTSSNSLTSRRLDETTVEYEVEPAPFTMVSITEEVDEGMPSQEEVDEEMPSPIISTSNKKQGEVASIVTGCVITAGLIVAFLYCAATGKLDGKADSTEKLEDVTSGSLGEGIPSNHNIGNDNEPKKRSLIKVKSMGHGQITME